jgi:hypothetical protein
VPEFRFHSTISYDVEVYIEAADEEEADAIADEVASSICLFTSPPDHDLISRESGYTVLDISWDGPNGSDINDGPWEE